VYHAIGEQNPAKVEAHVSAAVDQTASSTLNRPGEFGDDAPRFGGAWRARALRSSHEVVIASRDSDDETAHFANSGSQDGAARRVRKMSRGALYFETPAACANAQVAWILL